MESRTVRQLYDSIGQTLSCLTIQLELACKMQDKDPAQAKAALQTATELSRQCLETVQAAFSLETSSEE